MYKPSWTAIFSAIFLAYMANSLWSIASLYFPPTCDSHCLKNGIYHSSEFKSGLRLILLSTESQRPKSDKELSFVHATDITDFSREHSEEIEVKLSPKLVKKNTTQYLALFSLPANEKLQNAKSKWSQWICMGIKFSQE